MENRDYPHFMLQEIYQQPQSLRDTLAGRWEKGRVFLEELSWAEEEVLNLEKIALIACGTSRHAGMVARYLVERFLGIPLEDDIASEFRYRQPVLNPHTLALAISQSGETGDTLGGVEKAQRAGCPVLAITNNPDSTLARKADYVLVIRAGEERAIASTKAYTSQLAALYLLLLYLGEKRGATGKELEEMAWTLGSLPTWMEAALDLGQQVRSLGEKMASKEHIFFIGRGLDYPVALEGALKMKETAYVHGEGCAAGEFRHGPMALIEEGTPVVVLATQEDLWPIVKNQLKELRDRGAWVLAVTQEGNGEARDYAHEVVYIPPVPSLLAPPVAVVPLQLLAYYTALTRGCPIDSPRHLVKSVKD
ncbi:MAG TPA: isomerizing glutamine--fructose-6-phosphate transaminase [Moorella mulderi]|nr:isomerizing glutamine--fructose-6-phosphate transaminase [Moorella mulderi]